MALLTEERARVAGDFLANHASRMAAAKAPTNWILCGCDREVRKGSCASPVDSQYFFHLSHDQAWSFVFLFVLLLHGHLPQHRYARWRPSPHDFQRASEKSVLGNAWSRGQLVWTHCARRRRRCRAQPPRILALDDQADAAIAPLAIQAAHALAPQGWLVPCRQC